MGAVGSQSTAAPGGRLWRSWLATIEVKAPESPMPETRAEAALTRKERRRESATCATRRSARYAQRASSCSTEESAMSDSLKSAEVAEVAVESSEVGKAGRIAAMVLGEGVGAGVPRAEERSSAGPPARWTRWHSSLAGIQSQP